MKYKKLADIYHNTKGNKLYADALLDSFEKDAKNFLKDIRNEQVVASVKVSRSGMTRRFNFHKYNGLLNLLYNRKISYDPVKVSGCGMDMYWHLLYTACEILTKSKKVNYNLLCSYQILL